MAWFTRSSRFTMLVLTVTLTLGLAVKVPAQMLIQSGSPSLGSQLVRAFTPPGPPGTDGLPDRREGAATRGECFGEGKQVTALVPVTGMGQTVAEYPTIYWYTPKINPEEGKVPLVELKLRDANARMIYSAQYPLSAQVLAGTPGLMSLTIDKSHPLQTGHKYSWELRITCDPTGSDPSGDKYVAGGIERVEADPRLALRLRVATPQERVALYADAQLWYEMLGSLIELRRDRPYDQNLADAWDQLFNTVYLNEIAKEPLVQGARNVN